MRVGQIEEKLGKKNAEKKYGGKGGNLEKKESKPRNEEMKEGSHKEWRRRGRKE